MGFLDHSTNNIIVDAVLTDAGRQALARNDASFQIHQFALGDDEVDYNIIQQFGRTVGKEKIEKNTPVLEASTSNTLGLKNKLVTLNNEYLRILPLITIPDASLSFVRSVNSTSTSQELEIKITNKDTSPLEPQLIDSFLIIEMNNLFLTLGTANPEIIHGNNTAVYNYSTSTAINNSIIFKPTISLKTTIPDSIFNNYANFGSNNTTLTTYIKVTGFNTGFNKVIPVTITNS